jgi:hypothetical protein
MGLAVRLLNVFRPSNPSREVAIRHPPLGGVPNHVFMVVDPRFSRTASKVGRELCSRPSLSPQRGLNTGETLNRRLALLSCTRTFKAERATPR